LLQIAMSKFFKIGVVTMVLGMTIGSCRSPQASPSVSQADTTATDIPFTSAQGYFVKNSYTKPQLDNPKLSSQEEFDQVFGMAPVMGEKGTPTALDFASHDVIAVIGATTDTYTTLSAVGVTQLQNKIILHYKRTEGETLTYQMQPCLIVVLDKKYSDEFSTDLQ
jgi:hypothetical protein